MIQQSFVENIFFPLTKYFELKQQHINNIMPQHLGFHLVIEK